MEYGIITFKNERDWDGYSFFNYRLSGRTFIVRAIGRPGVFKSSKAFKYFKNKDVESLKEFVFNKGNNLKLYLDGVQYGLVEVYLDNHVTHFLKSVKVVSEEDLKKHLVYQGVAV